MAWYDLPTAKQKVTAYAQPKYGRGLTDDEFNEIGRDIGYSGGDIDDDGLSRAFQSVDRIAARYGAHPSRPPTLEDDVRGRAVDPGQLPAGGVTQWTPDHDNQAGGVPPGVQLQIPDESGQARPEAPPPTFQPPAPPTVQPPAPPTTAGGGGGGVSQQPSAAPSLDSDIERILRERLAALSGPFDPQGDTVYRGQVDAYKAAQQRGARRMRSAAAERAAQTGTLGSGGFDTEALGYQQDANTNEATFAAQLAGQRLSEREGQLMEAIQLARAVGQDDVAEALDRERIAIAQQQVALQGELGRGNLALARDDLALRERLGLGNLDLQRELGRGDLTLRDRGLGIQERLGQGDLDLRSLLGRGQLSLGLLGALMGNQQFYDRLGFDYTDALNRWNRDSILSLLGT